LNDFVRSVNAKLGTSQVLYAFLMILWPVSLFVFPRLKSRRAAAIVHLVYGIIMCYFMFQTRIFFAIATAVIGYLFLNSRPLYTFILAAIMNSMTHIYHLIHTSNQWSMEVTGTCIVIFQKIVSVSFNLDDGRRLKNGEKLSHRHFAPYSLDKKPSFLEWMAYCLTPYGGSTGPFIEFKMFELTLTGHERGFIKSDSKDRKMAIYRYLGSIGWAILTVIGYKYAKFSVYYSEQYLNANVFIRIAILIGITIMQAIKYYSVWWAVEASYFEFGFMSSPLSDGKDDFCFSNLSFKRVLESMNTGVWMQRWNHAAHLFWKHYLFCRILGSKVDFGRFEKHRYTIAHNAVFVASSAWHGFKPVYYLILPELLIAMRADKIINKKWPVTKDSSFFNVLFHRFFTIFSMLTATCTWWYSTFEVFVYVRNTVYWIPQIFSLLVLIIASIAPASKPKKTGAKEEKKEVKEEEKKEKIE
jgi:hypothetical protein